MDTMAAIRETFFQECEEQLGELEVGLLAMDEGDTNPETVNAVFRAVHSIKGGAGAFKLDRLVRFAHTFETTLDLIRSETARAVARRPEDDASLGRRPGGSGEGGSDRRAGRRIAHGLADRRVEGPRRRTRTRRSSSGQGGGEAESSTFSR